MNKDYFEAVAEVLDILGHTDSDLVQKIPNEFIEFLKENNSKDYVPNLDHTKKIKEMKLNPKTEAILGFIYLKYWADEEGKRKFEQKIKENEQFLTNELKTNFNKNIFEEKSTDIKKAEVSNNLPKEYANLNIISKIITKIKSIFWGSMKEKEEKR